MSATPAPLLPEDEPERLRSLRANEVLPTLIEPVFEEFVALTAQVFSLPISLIAVVEEDDVYYPANHGMPGNDQQPRVEALCSTAVQQSRAVVYHDLLLETAALTPEAVRAAEGNELRFYAGALLRLPNQPPLGTLCIIDRQPRTLSEAEQQLLEQLAALVSQAIAVRVTCLGQPTLGVEQWETVRAQLQEELRELTALVRYLFTRHGVQVPVPAELLTQVSRRLSDIKMLLDEHRCA
ncbi:GAF domain-containing protein [Hymenobacter armeniacus]|uniref:GAF domain-containing protein n=1 Tax=Hymenobacter armeniacus TaxID=2771358 RepID=A0ABR8JYJ3_9BACT|nr:GAF domain-containing protein [Hymenobacter armeniacus]MBD2723662.1 GAF domain-containing protein [Hymenobacter armeniacus]